MKLATTTYSTIILFCGLSMSDLIHAQSVDMGESLDFAEFHGHKADKQNTAEHAVLDPAAARIIALHSFPSTIISEEIEREDGGSGLRYSFEVANGAVSHEVGIDAVTGEVLENSQADTSIFVTEGRE